MNKDKNTVWGTVHEGKNLASNYGGLGVEDRNGLEECFCLVTDNLFPAEKQMVIMFDNIPPSIKADILMWGSSETNTREKICEWYRGFLKED